MNASITEERKMDAEQQGAVGEIRPVQEQALPDSVLWVNWQLPAAEPEQTPLPDSPVEGAEESESLPTDVKPLAQQEPQQQPYSWQQVERGRYWGRILTGDPDTIPADIQKAAGVDDAAGTLSPSEREYRLLRTVNRSWAADHLGMSREKIKSDWAGVRSALAEELGVAGNEQEVFTALSIQAQEAPQRELARSAYESEFLRTLSGELPENTAEGEPPALSEIRAMARAAAEDARERSLPHADALEQVMLTFSRLEGGPVEQMRAVWNSPQFLDAVDELADMKEDERAVLYRVMQAEWKRRGYQPSAKSLPVAMLRNVVRGGINMSYHLGQAAGNAAVAQLSQLGEKLGLDALNDFSAKQDKRLRMVEELRRVAQQEVMPIRLDEDASFAEELMVEAAGALPGVALSFAGVPGISLLAASSAGASVADARQRSPETNQKLQTAAGCLAGAAQAAIFRGMSGLGQRLIGRTLNEFARSVGQGARRYAVSALKSGARFTQENVNLLLAGKAAQLAEMGLQELASCADETASHIDWKGYGENALELETNIREAAMNLPFVLIAGGKAALHHFRSPRAVLGDGHRLDDWGVDPGMKERVMNAPTVQLQSELLREALRGSKRWAGAGFLSDVAARSLRLLQTKDLRLFDNERTVAQFLEHPGEQSVLNQLLRQRQIQNPGGEEAVRAEHAHLLPQRKLPAEKMQWLNRLMRGWMEKAGMLPGEKYGSQSANMVGDEGRHLSPVLRQRGYYLPQAERVRRGLLAEWVQTVEQLSHRFLLNTYTIDTLQRSCPSEKTALERTEKLRRQIPALVARAVLRGAMDGHLAEANASISNHFRDFYRNRRYNSIREPWLQKTSRAELNYMADMAAGNVRLSRHLPEEVREWRLQYLGLTSAVRGLVEVIPHMEDFHTFLSLGHSPLSAYAAILAREFGLPADAPDWKPEGWNPVAAPPDEAALRANTEHNLERMKVYSLLTGREPEMVCNSSGGELWRIRRPDGSFTRWHENSGRVANDMAYVYTMRLGLPYEKDWYGDRLQENMRVNGVEFGRVLPQQRRRFNTHDALGIIALNDLHELWMGNAATGTLGLEYHKRELPGVIARKSYDGVASFHQSGGREASPQLHLLDPKRTVNPLNLIFARARVYWQRMLDSGAVSPAEAADFLEQQGEITTARKQALLHMPEINRRLYRLPEVKKMTRKRQHKYVRQLRELLRNRDTAEMKSALSEALSYFSTKYLIADMEHLPVPDSVKEWIAAAPFRAPDSRTAVDRPGLIGSGRDSSAYPRNSDEFLIRWMNDKAAEFLQNNSGQMAALRSALKDEQSLLRQSPLHGLVRELWEPSEPQRKEQCWSYLLSGDKFFRQAGQELWNLLYRPETAWKRLSEAQQELLREDLLPVVRKYPSPGVAPDAPDALEQSLNRLQNLLAEYPHLHDYALNLRNPGEVLRIQLEAPPQPRTREQHTRALAKADLQSRIPGMQPGGAAAVSELPPEWVTDDRIMPALQLLTALRHQVMDYPYVMPQGISWRNQFYGGTSGLRPPGVTEDWKPAAPLGGLLNVLQRLETDMAGQQTELVGEILEPLNTEIDLSPLQHVTIYSNERYPAVRLRLMPGDFASASLFRRKPYVVHSLAGAPLPKSSGWRMNQEVGKVYHDMVHFDSNLERPSYDERYHKAGGFFAMVFNQLQTRLMDEQTLRLGRDADLSNREIIMHLAQDTGYSDKLNGADLSRFTPDEVVTLSLFRLLLAYEYGTNPDAAEAALLKLGARFREDETLFEQVKENILDSGEHGLDLIEATQWAEDNLIRHDDGTVVQQSYLPKQSREYRQVERHHGVRERIDDDARARDYMRNPRKHDKSKTYDGYR